MTEGFECDRTRTRRLERPRFDVRLGVPRTLCWASMEDLQRKMHETLIEEGKGERLPPPPFPVQRRGPGDFPFVWISEVPDIEDELVGYLHDFLRRAEKKRVLAVTVNEELFLEPALLEDGESLLAFAWTTGWRETRELLETFARSRREVLIDDLDQGWQLEVWREGEDLIFREGNWEEPEEDPWALLEAPAELVAEAAARCLEEMKTTLHRVESRIGRPAWRAANPLAHLSGERERPRGGIVTRFFRSWLGLD